MPGPLTPPYTDRLTLGLGVQAAAAGASVDITTLLPHEALDLVAGYVGRFCGANTACGATPPLSPNILTVATSRENSSYDVVLRSHMYKRFCCKTEPDIGIRDYLFRIQRFCPLSTGVILAAGSYLVHAAEWVPISPLTAHRLVLAACRCANKLLEDQAHSQRRFAKVGGLAEAELSRLEIGFLYLLDFNLRVDHQSLHNTASGFLECR